MFGANVRSDPGFGNGLYHEPAIATKVQWSNGPAKFFLELRFRLDVSWKQHRPDLVTEWGPSGIICSTWSKTETRKGYPQCLARLPLLLLPWSPRTSAYCFFQPFVVSISKQDLEALWGRPGRKWLTEKIRESREVIKKKKQKEWVGRIWCIETQGPKHRAF